MYKNLFILFLSAFILFACRQDDGFQLKGGLSIVLTDDVQVRSLPSELDDELTDKFMIQLIRQSDGNKEYNGLLSAFGDARAVHADVYDIIATYGDDKPLGLDEPYYTGNVSSFEIGKGESKQVTIPCSLANGLASFVLTNKNELDKRLKDYYIEITVGGNSVKWYPGDTTNPYFRSGEAVIFTLKGIWIETEADYSFPVGTIDAVEAKSNYIYKLTLNTSGTSSSNFDIQVDQQVEEVTINETVPQTWLPKPKIVAQAGFNEVDGIMAIAETQVASPALIALKSVKPIQDIKIKFDFKDESFVSLNKEYLLSALSEDDKTALEKVGIVLPLLDGTTSQVLDLTAFTDKFLCGEGGTDVDNKVTVSVMANDRWNERELNLHVAKPDFCLSAYPGNIWTKELTVNPLSVADVKTGSFYKIASDLKYEWSIDGVNWTMLADDFREADLIPGTAYYVRAIYRDEVVSEILQVNTYEQIVLENAGFENYKIVRGSDDAGFIKPKDYGAQYEWTSWATLNALTAGYSWKTAYSFNSRSGTRPTSSIPAGSPGSSAARIITLSCGGGGTDANPKAFSHSELFLGSYTEDGDKRNYGIAYNSHPTGVKFFYKCVSNMNNDVSEVKVQLYSDDVLLGDGIFQTGAKDLYEEHIVTIEYDENVEKQKLVPNKLSLIFKSGIKENLSKSDLKQFGSGVMNSQADPMWRGNELFIDNVSLVYDK